MKEFAFLTIGILLICGTISEAASNYAGWAVGFSWDGYGTILRSTDSGETWTRQGSSEASRSDFIADVNLADVFAVDSHTAWVVGSPDGNFATIYHTTDGGSTWQRKGSTTDVPNVDLAKVIAHGDKKVWAVGWRELPKRTSVILHSNDGGTTWTNQIPAEYENTALQGVYTPDGTNVWVTGANKNGYALILKSINAGQNWTRQSGGDVANADHLLGISAVDENTAWTVGGIKDGYIALHTTDGGTTWVHQTDVDGLYDANEVYAVNASVVWAACDHSVYWSTNGGENWDDSTNHGQSLGPYTLGISAVSSQEAWAARGGLGGSIYHTTDGGSTWTELNKLDNDQLPPLSAISFAPPRFPWELILPSITGKHRP